MALVPVNNTQELRLLFLRRKGEDEGFLPLRVESWLDDHAVGVLVIDFHGGVLGMMCACHVHIHDGVDEGDFLHLPGLPLVVGVLLYAEAVHYHEAGIERPEEATVPSVGQVEGRFFWKRILYCLRCLFLCFCRILCRLCRW